MSTVLGGLAIGAFTGGLFFALVCDPHAMAWMWVLSSVSAFFGTVLR